jgi:hypothetical protein
MLACIYCKGQKPILSVQSFEYIWQKDQTAFANQRVIIPSDDSARHSMQHSFARAIQQRWNIEVPEFSLSVKPLSFFSFSGSPKFNTKLKDKQANTWYLFLQIYDRGNSFLSYNYDDSLSTTLELKCRLVSGTNDSVILDRSLSVNMYKEPAPPDQVVLVRLPSYPPYFVQAFDSIAAWLFQADEINEKNIRLKPACVFIETNTTPSPVAQLAFESDHDNIDHHTEPVFSFHTPGPIYAKTKSIKNTGGNLASGAITLLSGVNINKERAFEYNADFPFEMKDSTAYHCVIHYAEHESAEREREKTTDDNGSKMYSVRSSSYNMNERHIDSSFLQVITLGRDTLATFHLVFKPGENEKNSYTRFWDGNDSATISALPRGWTNSKAIANAMLSGKMAGQPFFMNTSNEITAKEFFINGQPAMIMYGKTVPAKALLFQPLSAQQVKLFTILSAVPYAYFNYTSNTF